MAWLLTSDDNVPDVALAAGFPTLSSFYRQFKEETGLSPSRWRK